jgi:hypothetical protein
LTDKDGLDITLVAAQDSASYTGNTWTTTVWDFPLDSFPLQKRPIVTPYVEGPITFSDWEIMNGANIALSDSYGDIHYTGNTWTTPTWIFQSGIRPTLNIQSWERASGVINYSNWESNVISMYGANITLAQAKQEVTYSSNTWLFGTVWAIIENETFPLLLNVDGQSITDPALSSRKVYVFITEDLNGSLFAEGKVWKSLKRSITFPSTTGLNGVSLTHSYGGESINDSLDEGPYVYKFSGIQDPARPGGYGTITTATERTVTYMSARSNNVAFYYGTVPIPAYDYLLSIQGNSMVFHLAVFLADVSKIKVVMPDGLIGYVGLVPVDDPEASLIRVLTLDGIFALQGVEGVEQPAPMMARMFAAPAPYVTETEYRITYARTGAISTIGKTGSSLFAAPFISNGGDIREVSLHGKKREEGADIRIIIAKDLGNKPDMTKILYQGSSRMFPVDMSKMTEYVNDIPTMNGETLWLMFDARDSTAGAGDAGTATDGHGPFKYSNDGGVTWFTHANNLAMDVLLVTKTTEGEV